VSSCSSSSMEGRGACIASSCILGMPAV
jgi:hypothetical protein